ncbi:hypothetical protein C8F04DRAFT_1340443 [Mycena alexandri]|uniref:Uncharacterized protein n=1 Tax=Mycena alexandri TaxID=1745969 RepID=A0AAD6SY73_9AGAR|nr:hypothetical protein C8F04DRAFT_1340443 [Mycena alexandri]
MAYGDTYGVPCQLRNGSKDLLTSVSRPYVYGAASVLTYLVTYRIRFPVRSRRIQRVAVMGRSGQVDPTRHGTTQRLCWAVEVGSCQVVPSKALIRDQSPDRNLCYSWWLAQAGKVTSKCNAFSPQAFSQSALLELHGLALTRLNKRIGKPKAEKFNNGSHLEAGLGPALPLGRVGSGRVHPTRPSHASYALDEFRLQFSLSCA